MLCGNRLCIYWKNHQCRLKVISVDDKGRCECYTQVRLDEPQLEKLRQDMLKRYSDQEFERNSKKDKKKS